jgi:hypothetical protein
VLRDKKFVGVFVRFHSVSNIRIVMQLKPVFFYIQVDHYVTLSIRRYS